MSVFEVRKVYCKYALKKHEVSFSFFQEMDRMNTYEPPHDKTNKVTCAPSELRSAWASAQSDQSSLCAQ